MPKKKQLVFEDKLDAMFVIAEEMIIDHGEDSYYCAFDDRSALVSAFDGCGGLGAQRYDNLGNHTGAYLGARLISGAMCEWFHNRRGEKWSSGRELTNDIAHYVREAFQIGAKYAKSNVKLRGSMVRNLPTTAAIAYVEDYTEGELLHVIWAGDSRVYILDRNGLAQLTVDDTDSDSAFDNISNDAVLNNVLSSDGNYTLHYKRFQLTQPSMLLVMTDGCHGYLATPMELEFMVEMSLLQSANLDQYKSNLRHLFGEFAGDDYTFGFAGFGYGTFANMKQSVKARYNYMKKQYIDVLEEKSSDAVRRELWEIYRKEYERYIV